MPKNPKALSLFIILILVGLSAAAFFILSREKTVIRNSDQNTPQTSIGQNKNNNQVSGYQQHTTPIPGTDVVWYAIPELGIRMKVGSELANDLVYEFGPYKDGSRYGAVYLALKSEIRNETVRISESNNIIGAISKIDGRVDESGAYFKSRFESPYDKYSFKQFDDFFLYLETPNTAGGCRDLTGICGALQTAEKFSN